MAAPRLYSDAQRTAMFRLFEAGKTPAEIARLCEEGTAGTSPFTIPRRTVHDIVTRMAEEAEQKLPTSVVEAESAEAVERFPARIARILDAEIDRLNAKQAKHGLNPTDYDKLARVADLSFDLHKRLRQRRPRTSRGQGGGEGTSVQPRPGSELERLAREQREQAGDGEQLTDARTCLAPSGDSEAGRPESPPRSTAPATAQPGDAAAEDPTTASQGAAGTPPSLAATINQARKTATAAKQAEAAEKARAALAAIA